MLATAAAPAAPDLAGAHDFVARIYAHYPVPDVPNFWDPVGKDERSIYDASLMGLLAEDERLAHGEVGALDGDPLCDCQDDGGLSFSLGNARAEGANGARVEVVRHDLNVKPPGLERIQIILRRTHGVWRIHDVGTPDSPSLRAYLAEENRKRRH